MADRKRFTVKASDDSLHAEATRLYRIVKDTCTNTEALLSELEEGRVRVKKAMHGWRDLRSDTIIADRLPLDDAPAPTTPLTPTSKAAAAAAAAAGTPAAAATGLDHADQVWEALEKVIAQGLHWEKKGHHVPKRPRSTPVPRDAKDLTSIEPCPMLEYELSQAALDAEGVLQLACDFGSLLEVLAPMPKEGEESNGVLTKLRSRLNPTRSALKSVITMHCDYLSCRGTVEEEYYKNPVQGEWTEVLDVLDFSTWQKIERTRTLLLRVVSYMASVYQKNVTQIEKFYEKSQKKDDLGDAQMLA